MPERACTGTNLVYGYGLKDKGSYSFLPVYRLVIMDEKFEEIKSYQAKKTYISEVEITDTIISMKRWKKGKQISDDQLLDNTEDKASVAKSSYFMDDMKQRELALAFTNNHDASEKLKVGDAAQVKFDHNAEVKSTFEQSKEEKVYAYGYGKLQAICYNRKEAIAIAKKNCGLVTDENGKKIWVFEENYN